MVPGNLAIGINVVGWDRETAGASRIARSEGVAVSEPVELNEETVLIPEMVIDSARRLFALEKVPEGLRLLPIKGNALAKVGAADRQRRIQGLESCLNWSRERVTVRSCLLLGYCSRVRTALISSYCGCKILEEQCGR